MKHQDTIKKLGKEKCLAMYRRMLEIRIFEEKIRELFLQGKMPGTVHQYIGEEACAVGVTSALQENDVIASTHRPHGHAIAKGIPLKEVAAELYGKVTGCCKGKGGSMHVGDINRGMLPAIAIVGGNIPIVTGMALAFKLRKESRVAVSFFGDGASNEGAFHEGINAASIYDVPALFVCENNQYGASTNVKRVMRIEHIVERAASYGIASEIGDGMDVLDVYEKTEKAAKRARGGGGPFLLELKTFRLCGHSRRDPNNYMTKEEKKYWKGKDPIPAFEKVLTESKTADTGELQNIRQQVNQAVDEAIIFGQESPEPKAEDTFEDLYITCEVPR